MFLDKIAQERELCKQSERAGLVDSVQYRLMRRAKLVSEELIAPEGGLNQSAAEALLRVDFPLHAALDSFFSFHVKQVVKFLLESKKAQIRLKQLNFPLANPWVDDLVRFSVWKKKEEKLQKRDIAVALLMALLMPIRQSVGSCFATATVIQMQRNSVETLFHDLSEVLNRGSLKRVVLGEERRVPLAIKTGMQGLTKVMKTGSINDPILQKLLDDPPPVKNPETIKSYLAVHAKNPKETQELFKAHLQSPIMKCFEYTLAAFADFNVGFAKWNFSTAIGLMHDQQGGVGEVLWNRLQEEMEKSNEKVAEYADRVNQAEEKIRRNQSLFRASYRQDELRRLKREAEAEMYQSHTYEALYEEEIRRREALAELYKFFAEQYQILFPHYFQEIYDPELFTGSEEFFVDSPAGFRLAYKHGRYDPTVWTLIESDEDYIRSLIDFFRLAEPILLSRLENKEIGSLVEQLISEVILYVETPEFLTFSKMRILEMHKKYLPEGQPVSPYAYVSGGSLRSLMQSYFAREEQPTEELFHPKNAEELLYFLIEFMKDAPAMTSSIFEQNSHKGMLIRSPSHAFVFLPGAEDFKAMWLSSSNTHTCIRDQVVGSFRDWYEKTRIEKADVDRFFPFLPHTFWQGEMNSQEFYERLKQTQTTLFYWEELFFRLLLEKGLPRPLVFADSNWLSDYFAFILHPKTEQIVLYRYNGNYLAPIHGVGSFFNGDSWALYPKMDEYTLEH